MINASDSAAVDQFIDWVTSEYDSDVAQVCKRMVDAMRPGETFVAESLAWHAYQEKHKIVLLLAERTGTVRFHSDLESSR